MIQRKTKSNPTDHDLISQLEVKKTFPAYGVRYEVYLGKKRIGFADIDRGKTEISFVNINEEYRRKGVSSFLYDYIEKNLGHKLKPSADLLDDGDKFWKARSKKSNPRDEEFLKKIKIIKCKFYDDESGLKYFIYYKDECLGFAEIFDNDHHINFIKIFKESDRKKGLATFLYDYIENDLRIKLKPSDSQLDDGIVFWKSRLKKNPSPKTRKTK